MRQQRSGAAAKNTVLSYAYKRYITGMCVDGETLLLPDIEKPYIPRKRIDGQFGLLQGTLANNSERTVY